MPGTCQGASRCAATASPNEIRAVVRKGDALELVGQEELKTRIGAIDSAEEAALVARLTGMFVPATCAQVATEGYACAPDSPAEGVAARRVDGGWELVTFDSRYVCQEVERDMAGQPVDALGVMKITPSYRAEGVSNDFTREISAQHKDEAQCGFPVPGSPPSPSP